MSVASFIWVVIDFATGSGFVLTVSMACAIAAAGAARLVYLCVRRFWTDARWCPTCKYDLAGHAKVEQTTCPECGSPNVKPPLRVRQITWWASITFAMLALAALTLALRITPSAFAEWLPHRMVARLLASRIVEPTVWSPFADCISRRFEELQLANQLTDEDYSAFVRELLKTTAGDPLIVTRTDGPNKVVACMNPHRLSTIVYIPFSFELVLKSISSDDSTSVQHVFNGHTLSDAPFIIRTIPLTQSALPSDLVGASGVLALRLPARQPLPPYDLEPTQDWHTVAEIPAEVHIVESGEPVVQASETTDIPGKAIKRVVLEGLDNGPVSLIVEFDSPTVLRAWSKSKYVFVKVVVRDHDGVPLADTKSVCVDSPTRGAFFFRNVLEVPLTAGVSKHRTAAWSARVDYFVAEEFAGQLKYVGSESHPVTP